MLFGARFGAPFLLWDDRQATGPAGLFFEGVRDLQEQAVFAGRGSKLQSDW
jgi:hypothetical protein